MKNSLTDSIQAILFDLDGTMLDTSFDFIFIINRMLNEDNRPELAPELIRAHVSMGSRGLIELAYQISTSDPGFDALRQRLLDNYETHILAPDRDHPAHLFHGMEALLVAIESQDIPWGIVTNKPRYLTEPLLHQLDLHKRCAVLVCPEDVAKAKPSPEALWLAADKLGCDSAQCLYIGDHPRDIQAGKAAGMATIAASYGFIMPDDCIDDWHADYTASSPQDILHWLSEHGWINN